MGLLDKLGRGAGRPAEPPPLGSAVVTGIQGRDTEDGTDLVFRFEWDGGGDGEPRDGAVRFGADAPPALRLGAEVLIRRDGRAVVLDVDAMAADPGAPRTSGTRTRRVPPRGIDDKTLSGRLRRRLQQWAPARAVVTSWTRGTVLGLAANRWDVVVTVPDGTAATVPRALVPSYARWFVHPGSEVPVVVDPGDPSSVQIDWLTLAEERAGGRWDDIPPEGSIAAALCAPAGGSGEDTASPAAVGDGGVDPTPGSDATEPIEGVSLEQWALVQASLVRDRVPPAGYDAYATERYDVPAGRWTAIAGAWEQRTRADWKVGAAFGEAYERARRDLLGSR